MEAAPFWRGPSRRCQKGRCRRFFEMCMGATAQPHNCWVTRLEFPESTQHVVHQVVWQSDAGTTSDHCSDHSTPWRPGPRPLHLNRLRRQEAWPLPHSRLHFFLLFQQSKWQSSSVFYTASKAASSREKWKNSWLQELAETKHMLLLASQQNTPPKLRKEACKSCLGWSQSVHTKLFSFHGKDGFCMANLRDTAA